MPEKTKALYQGLLDTLVVAKAKTGWMEANSKDIQYLGGKDIKIASILLSGTLGDYIRDEGYKTINASASWETKPLQYDRAVKIPVDVMDADETGITDFGLRAVQQLVVSSVVPEVDKLRISDVAKEALPENIKEVTSLTTTNIVKEFKAGIDAVLETGYEGVIYAHITRSTHSLLEEKFANQLGAETFNINGVDTRFHMFDDVRLIVTPKKRMNTLFEKVIPAGGSAKDAVFEAKGGEINFLIVGEAAPIAVVKHEPLDVVPAAYNADLDSDIYKYRLFHGIFVPENKKPLIYVNHLKAPAGA